MTRTTTTRPHTPLTMTKLESCEDESIQAMLTRLAEADQRFGRDMVLQGAFPQTCEDWARLHQFVDQAVPCESLNMLESVISRAYANRLELAYLGGVAVGLRLARMDAPAVPPKAVTR